MNLNLKYSDIRSLHAVLSDYIEQEENKGTLMDGSIEAVMKELKNFLDNGKDYATVEEFENISTKVLPETLGKIETLPDSSKAVKEIQRFQLHLRRAKLILQLQELLKTLNDWDKTVPYPCDHTEQLRRLQSYVGDTIECLSTINSLKEHEMNTECTGERLSGRY